MTKRVFWLFRQPLLLFPSHPKTPVIPTAGRNPLQIAPLFRCDCPKFKQFLNFGNLMNWKPALAKTWFKTKTLMRLSILTNQHQYLFSIYFIFKLFPIDFFIFLNKKQINYFSLTNLLNFLFWKTFYYFILYKKLIIKILIC